MPPLELDVRWPMEQGTNDEIFPIEDSMIPLQHGSVKEARYVFVSHKFSIHEFWRSAAVSYQMPCIWGSPLQALSLWNGLKSCFASNNRQRQVLYLRRNQLWVLSFSIGLKGYLVSESCWRRTDEPNSGKHRWGRTHFDRSRFVGVYTIKNYLWSPMFNSNEESEVSSNFAGVSSMNCRKRSRVDQKPVL